ncbi:MAG: MarR family transcriptional regulator [Magnetococcales bacterium]|nr:MarR family transcriptional regulator [Magnetococcales bacterium]
MELDHLQVIEQIQSNWPESYDPLTTPFFFTLHSVHTRIMAESCKIMGEYHFSPAEFDVLSTLRRAPAPHELTPSQLQQSLLITSGGLTKILHQLQTRELITRSTAATDRRIKPVRLTAKAVPIVEQVLKIIVENNSRSIRNALSNTEIEQATLLLTLLAKHLHQPPAMRQEGCPNHPEPLPLARI